MQPCKNKDEKPDDLQVHDELVFDALKTEVHELKPLILENMESGPAPAP